MFLGYGSPEYVGLGFSVMVALVFIELFGSIFMKNCNVIIALLFGYFVAGVSRYEDDDGNSLRKLKTTKVAAIRTSAHRWMIRLPYNAGALSLIFCFPLQNMLPVIRSRLLIPLPSSGRVLFQSVSMDLP